MKRLLAFAVLLLPLLVQPASAETSAFTPGNYSQTIGTSVVQMVGPVSQPGPLRAFMHIQVVAGSGTAWCTFDGTTPAANAPGSWPFAASGQSLSGYDWSPQSTGWVPQAAVQCVATAAGTVVNLFVWPQ